MVEIRGARVLAIAVLKAFECVRPSELSHF
jgi:hypothetical protein